MRIFFASPLPLDTKAGAGATVHVTELVRSLEALGHAVTLFVPVYGCSGRSFDLPVVEMRVPDVPIITPVLRNFVFVRHLMSRISLERPDVIYARHSRSFVGPAAVAVARNCPLVLEINDDPLQGLMDDRGTWFKATLVRWVERVNCTVASRIVAVADGFAKIVQRRTALPPSKFEIINNGVNVQVFKPREARRVRSELGLQGGYRYVVFAGHLGWWQGLEVLVEAAPIVLQHVPEARFVVVGGGPFRGPLMKAVRACGVDTAFEIIGAVSVEESALYMNAADVCVAPESYARAATQFGVSPIKIPSYLASGRPVVASRIPGVGTVVEEHGAGLAVTPEDPEDLARGIVSVLSNEARAREMGINARKAAVECLSWETVASRVADVCQNAVADRE